MRYETSEVAQAVKVPHTNLILVEFDKFQRVECSFNPPPSISRICEQYRRGNYVLPPSPEKKIDLNGHELHSDYRKIPHFCLQYHPVEQEIRDCTGTPE